MLNLKFLVSILVLWKSSCAWRPDLISFSTEALSLISSSISFWEPGIACHDKYHCLSFTDCNRQNSKDESNYNAVSHIFYLWKLNHCCSCLKLCCPTPTASDDSKVLCQSCWVKVKFLQKDPAWRPVWITWPWTVFWTWSQASECTLQVVAV